MGVEKGEPPFLSLAQSHQRTRQSLADGSFFTPTKILSREKLRLFNPLIVDTILYNIRVFCQVKNLRISILM